MIKRSNIFLLATQTRQSHINKTQTKKKHTLQITVVYNITQNIKNNPNRSVKVAMIYFCSHNIVSIYLPTPCTTSWSDYHHHHFIYLKTLGNTLRRTLIFNRADIQ